MLKHEVFSEYRKMCEFNESFYKELKSRFNPESDIQEICRLRGYLPDSDQSTLLEELNIGSCTLLDKDLCNETANKYGYLNTSGFFLLDDRFIIPVRDICGNLVTLIGYYPDRKKYITVPTPFFSKELMFFNIDDAFIRSWEDYNGVVILVEGIFDCLSLRAIGLPAIATMGSDVSYAKREVLRNFNRVIYIPDNDSVGRRALNRYDKMYGWKVPANAVGVRLMGEVDFNEEGMSDEDKILKVKDTDNLVSWFDADSVRDSILQFANTKEEIVTLEL